MIMITGTQTEFEVLMCDAAVQCNLLDPPMTSTPKKGEVPAIEDEDPFELTEEEESEADLTGSTIYRDTTTSEDEGQIPLEKQMTSWYLNQPLCCCFQRVLPVGAPLFPSKDISLEHF